MIEKLKTGAGMLTAGGLGILGASSLFALPAMAQGLDPAGAAGLLGGAEGFGSAAVIGVLVWLLQGSTRERVGEAKEYAEQLKLLQQSHLDQVKQLNDGHLTAVREDLQESRLAQQRLFELLQHQLYPQPNSIKR